VVVVLAAEAVDVQGDAGSLGEALEAVRDHLAAQAAEPLALEAKIHDAVGAIREVDYGAGQGFVQRGVCVSVASETGGRTEGLKESAAERNANVLGCVVVVN
jgi:hypothetical protein